MKFYTESSTSQFQKETGDTYVYTKKGKFSHNAVNVANILGLGSWNIILVQRNGERVSKKLIDSGIRSKEIGIKKAKEYLKTLK